MVEVVATKWNVKGDPASKVDVEGNKIMANMKGRSYFADTCMAGKYNHTDYVALPLLGRVMTFTVDLSNVGCGCNAAFYLTNLHQNSELSDCEDYYCDANSVCGVPCPEIDIMESNYYAWHSTVHTEDDRNGKAAGYGGGGADWSGPRDFDETKYGPGASCIDTNSPFQVASGFPVNGMGTLSAMVITLYQEGKLCNLTLTIDGYDGNQTIHGEGSGQGMPLLTEALRQGMTPIVSFWEADDMLWLDGKGKDGMGPCTKDLEKACPDKVPMYDFKVEAIPAVEEEHGRWWLYLGLGAVVVGALMALLYFIAQKNTHDLLSEESDDDASP